MKTIQIKPLAQLKTIGILFLFFNLLNAGSILYFKTNRSEFFSEMDFVALLTLGAYFAYLIIRIFVWSFLVKNRKSMRK